MKIIANVHVLQKTSHKFLQRYLDMLNFVFKHLFKEEIYLENTEKGFVLICESIDYFRAFWGKYPKKDIIKCKNEPLEENFLLKKDLNETNFPKEGLRVLIKFAKDSYTPEVGEIIKKFFGRFSDSINVQIDLPEVILNFPEYKDIKLYTDLLHLKFKRVFPKTNL